MRKHLIKSLIFLAILISPRLFADLLDNVIEPKPNVGTSPNSNPSPSQIPNNTQKLSPKSPSQPPPAPQDKPHLKSGPSSPAADTKKEPINFRGEGLSGLREKGYVEIHKDVVVTQGDLKLESQKAEVYYDENNNDIKKIIVKGKVKLTRPSIEEGQSVKASSDIAEFDAVKQQILLHGNAELVKGSDVIKGNFISYDLKTGWINASKVRGVVKP